VPLKITQVQIAGNPQTVGLCEAAIFLYYSEKFIAFANCPLLKKCAAMCIDFIIENKPNSNA
jgi:hypothetical protein